MAVLRRRESMIVEMLEEALHSDQPLNVFKTVSDPKAAAAIHDMSAFALRSDTIREVGRQCLETVIALQTRALELELKKRKITAKVSPAAIAMLISGASPDPCCESYFGRGCIFDIYKLERYPDGAQIPSIEVEYAEDWRAAQWGLILKQDFQNLEAVQRAIKVRGFRGARPNPVKERALSNFHEVLNRYVHEKD